MGWWTRYHGHCTLRGLDTWWRAGTPTCDGGDPFIMVLSILPPQHPAKVKWNEAIDG